MEKGSGNKEDGAEAEEKEKRKPRRERKEDEVADDKAQDKAVQDAIPGKARRKRGEDQRGDSSGGWLGQTQDNPNKPIPEPSAVSEDGTVVTYV